MTVKPICQAKSSGRVVGQDGESIVAWEKRFRGDNDKSEEIMTRIIIIGNLFVLAATP